MHNLRKITISAFLKDLESFNNLKILIVGPNFRQAQLFFNKIEERLNYKKLSKCPDCKLEYKLNTIIATPLEERIKGYRVDVILLCGDIEAIPDRKYQEIVMPFLNIRKNSLWTPVIAQLIEDPAESLEERVKRLEDKIKVMEAIDNLLATYSRR
jgi:hypothetical protein